MEMLTTKHDPEPVPSTFHPQSDYSNQNLSSPAWSSKLLLFNL
jgi:hypothetical protein